MAGERRTHTFSSTLNKSSGRAHSQWYEKLTAEIHRIFDPAASIQHDEKILGKSGRERQIDVSIRRNVDGNEVFIIVECKYHGTPVGIGMIDELVGKLEDVGAHKAILVSDSGFRKGALQRARSSGKIDVVSIVDNEIPDLRTRVTFSLHVCFHKLSFPFNVQCKIYGPYPTTFGRVSFEEIQSLLTRTINWVNQQAPSLTQGSYQHTESIEYGAGRRLELIFSFEKIIKCYYTEKILADAKGVYDHNQMKMTEGDASYTYEVSEEDCIKNWKEIAPGPLENKAITSVVRQDLYNVEAIPEWAKQTFDEIQR